MRRTVWTGLGDGSVAYDPGMMDALLTAQSDGQPVSVMPDPLQGFKDQLSAFVPQGVLAPVALGAIALGLALALAPSSRRGRR